jgi:hypothetical protein
MGVWYLEFLIEEEILSQTRPFHKHECKRAEKGHSRAGDQVAGISFRGDM